MKILWVTAEPPDRHGGGGNIRQSYLLEALANRHVVDLLVAGGRADEAVQNCVRQYLPVAVSPPWRPVGKLSRRLLDLGLAVRGGPPELFEARASLRAIARSWPSGPYDAVVVEMGQLGSLVTQRRSGESWFCTLHNIPSGSLQRLSELAEGRRQKWIFGRQARQATAMEDRILADFDTVITVSAEDAALLRRPSRVVPNGVDLQTFPFLPLPSVSNVVFTGTLSYWPNVDGLQWFCDRVFPVVQQAIPDATLSIVGRDPTTSVVDLAQRPGVSVYQNVPSVRSYLAAARVAVVPLRFGSGTRLKAAEALASGRPLVGTSTGLAGLGLDGQAIVADMPEDIAAGIIKLIEDDELAASMAMEGRRLAEGELSWTSIGETFCELFTEIPFG